MSQALRQFDEDQGQGLIYKRGLRCLLFSYNLPLRPQEFEQLWSRYDPEGRGCVTVDDFLDRRILQDNYDGVSDALNRLDEKSEGTLKVEELLRLLRTYGCSVREDQLIRHLRRLKVSMDANCSKLAYLDFLSAFDHHTEKKCEQRPPAPLDGTWELVRSPIETKTSGIPEVLEQIQEVVSHRLYEIIKEIPPTHTRRDTISKDEFRQLCDRRFMRLTRDQFECVWDKMPVNELGKLQYREFLKRFGPEDETTTHHPEAGRPATNVPFLSPEPRQTLSPTKSRRAKTADAVLQRCKSAPQCTPRPASSSARRRGTGSSPPGDVERRLRGEVQRCWRDIQKRCTEEDPCREGEIRAVSFLDILQSLNISLTRDEFEHLAEKFDITNNGCISYPDFLRHFLLNVKPPEVKRLFDRPKLPLHTTVTSRGVLSSACVEAMLRIYEVVRLSWRSIRRCFLTSDRGRTGNISTQDFRKVLRHFSVNLSEEEFFHLSSYFDASAAGTISYNDFLRAFLR
ncbi:EF-hand calcium-binding domain-containing protein 6-like [Diretmus argenteus]